MHYPAPIPFSAYLPLIGISSQRSKWDLGQLWEEARALKKTASTNSHLIDLVRDYVGAYAWRHGQGRTAEAFGVSRHTVWRFLHRGHAGRRLPSAVMDAFGGDPVALIPATWKLNGNSPSLAFGHARTSLPERLRDTLLLLCATPLATVEELSCFDRVADSTLRDRLARLTERELIDSIPHRLGTLGPHPRRRYFPTEKCITAAGAATKGQQHVLELYPVSCQWMRLLAERLDAVAVLHHVAAMVAEADPSGDPDRVDHYRHGPYDLLIILSGDALHRPDPPWARPGHSEPSLSPQEQGAAGLQRGTSDNPGTDPLQSGDAQGDPLSQRPVCTPDDAGGLGAGAAHRGRRRLRLAAVRDRPWHSRPDRPGHKPYGHREVCRPAGRSVHLIPTEKAKAHPEP